MSRGTAGKHFFPLHVVVLTWWLWTVCIQLGHHGMVCVTFFEYAGWVDLTCVRCIARIMLVGNQVVQRVGVGLDILKYHSSIGSDFWPPISIHCYFVQREEACRYAVCYEYKKNTFFSPVLRGPMPAGGMQQHARVEMCRHGFRTTRRVVLLPPWSKDHHTPNLFHSTRPWVGPRARCIRVNIGSSVSQATDDRETQVGVFLFRGVRGGQELKNGKQVCIPLPLLQYTRSCKLPASRSLAIAGTLPFRAEGAAFVRFSGNCRLPERHAAWTPLLLTLHPLHHRVFLFHGHDDIGS